MRIDQLHEKQDTFIKENYRRLTDKQIYEQLLLTDYPAPTADAVKMRRIRMGLSKYNKKVKIDS